MSFPRTGDGCTSELHERRRDENEHTGQVVHFVVVAGASGRAPTTISGVVVGGFLLRGISEGFSGRGIWLG